MALSGWAMKKFKKLRRHRNESLQWLDRVWKASPNLFAHWTVAKVNG
jgi:RNA-directed DNA polymerase